MTKKSKRACGECHQAKGKCELSAVGQRKCDRCLKANKDCVPHVSRQGQRPKKDEDDRKPAAAARKEVAAKKMKAAAGPPAAPPVAPSMGIPVCGAVGVGHIDMFQGLPSAISVPAPPVASAAAPSLAPLGNLGTLGIPIGNNASTNQAQFGAFPGLLKPLSNLLGPNTSAAQLLGSNIPAQRQDNTSLISHLQNMASLNLAGQLGLPKSPVAQANPSASNFQHPALAAALESVINNQANREDPHISLFLGQMGLPAGRAAAPTARANSDSLLSMVQNNVLGSSMGSQQAAAPAPANMFAPPSAAAAQLNQEQLLDALVKHVQGQQRQVTAVDQQHLGQDLQRLRIQQIMVQYRQQNQQQAGPPASVAATGQGMNPQSSASGASSGASSGSKESDSQVKSRLKKTKKAHFLAGSNDAKSKKKKRKRESRSSTAGSASSSSLHQQPPAQQQPPEPEAPPAGQPGESLKQPDEPLEQQGESPAPQQEAPREERQEDSQPAGELQRAAPPQFLPLEEFVPEASVIVHLVKTVGLPNLKCHYGVRCLIREWIAVAFSKRSFGTLGQASRLASISGLSMDQILCGVDEDGKKADQSSDKDQNSTKTKAPKLGGRMNHLLSMLLEPRSVQAVPVEDRQMLRPILPDSLLHLVAPRFCRTFQDLNAQNRWIMILERNRCGTKFYCSPMFERNVLCWTIMSQIHEDNVADIFTLIFGKGENFDKFASAIAQQVSTHHCETEKMHPSRAPMTKIRLFSKKWGNTEYGDVQFVVTKDMVKENALSNNIPTIDVDVMLTSVQTPDKHLYYLEFYEVADPDGYMNGQVRSVTPDLPVLPTYAEVQKQINTERRY